MFEKRKEKRKEKEKEKKYLIDTKKILHCHTHKISVFYFPDQNY